MSGISFTALSDAPALPRLHTGQHRALNRLIAAGPPFGAGNLQVRFMSSLAAPRELEAWARHRFELGPHAGTVAFDAPLVRTLLGEPHADRLPRELRTTLLADALLVAVQRVESAMGSGFRWLPGEAADPRGQEGCFGFTLLDQADAAWLRGWVAFDDPSALERWVPASLRPHPRRGGRFDGLRLPLRFVVGSTVIPVRDMRQIAPGDVVSIEQWSSQGPALRVAAIVGHGPSLQLPALADGARITLESLGDPAMMNAPDPANPALGAAEPEGLPVERIDALEVRLRFEVGELSVSLGELRSLGPGHVFELPQPINNSTVRILAHGNLLGRGTLVAVGDRLGVRVSEFAGSA